MSTAIEWMHDGKECSYSWCGYQGKELPIPTVGTDIHIDGNDDFPHLREFPFDKYESFLLRVTRIKQYYTVGQALLTYVKCDVLECRERKS